MKPTFILASSTTYGAQIGQSLLDHHFACLAALTPPPHPLGRTKIPTPTPVATWAQKKHLPLINVAPKLAGLQTQLSAFSPPDFLIVVDFGYFIPAWLNHFPQALALNLHPSALPAYRGASPGQYVLKNGDSSSALSIITIAPTMDTGDLLQQIPFTVQPDWNAKDYYDHAFSLALTHLPTILNQYLQGKLHPLPQKGTPSFAPKITKQAAFIPYPQVLASFSDLQLATPIHRLIRAFNPWPLVWTKVKTSSGEKRLQLLTAHLTPSGLALDQVRLAGESHKSFFDLQQKIL
jgi:methionyl-tRNA formyltransferase